MPTPEKTPEILFEGTFTPEPSTICHQDIMNLIESSVHDTTLGEHVSGYNEFWFPHFIEDAYYIAGEAKARLEISWKEALPPEEELNIYTQIHHEIYKPKAEEFAQDILTAIEKGQPLSLVIESCMYGGKSTLAMLIRENLLKNENVDVMLAISSVMGEKFITARAYSEERFPAEQYGPLAQDQIGQDLKSDHNYTVLKKQIEMQKKAGKDVVLILDEFSFLSGKSLIELEEFHDYCRANGVTTIYVGLNKDYTGTPLEVFKKEKQSRIITDSERYKCKAFIPGHDTPETGPTGEYTTRYLVIPDNNGGYRLFLDLGVYPQVTSKEERNADGVPLAIYLPTTKQNTMSSILRENPNLFRSLTGMTSLQLRMLDALRNHSYQNC